jgi:hypothetical protein
MGVLMGIIRNVLNGLLPSRGGEAKDAAIKVHGHQIVYNSATREGADPDFEHLENAGSERADWFEYWPIQKFLRDNTLDESAVYGFLSTKFSAKTSLSGVDALRFMEASGDADVFTFSPFPQHGAFFLNVFEQGQFFDAEFFQSANDFFRSIDPAVDVRRLINHSGNLVYSNFFFAKPRFWREWLRVCDILFKAAEDGPCRKLLCEDLVYTTSDGTTKVVQRKVFIMERVASYLLARHHNYVVVNYPIWKMQLFDIPLEFVPDIYSMDDLKKTMHAHAGDAALLKKYRNEQRRIIPSVWPDASCAFIE